MWDGGSGANKANSTAVPNEQPGSSVQPGLNCGHQVFQKGIKIKVFQLGSSACFG